MSDLARGLAQLNSTQPGYIEAAKYYDGNTADDMKFFSDAIKRKFRSSGTDKMRLNFARVAVDAVASRIELNNVASPDEKAQSALQELWDSNQLDLELPGLFLKTLTFGDSFLILDGDPETGIQLFYNSPLSVQVIYSVENPRQKEFAIKRWSVPATTGNDTYIRVNLYYPDRIERYYTLNKDAKGEVETDFRPYVGPDEDDTEPIIENVYGFIPVYHFRTALHASPEHKEAYSAQDAINKIAINHLASIDFQGFPQRWIMLNEGQDSTEIDDFDADLFHDAETPQPTAVGTDQYSSHVAPSSPLKADPGTVWTLPNAQRVGQFDPADSKNFLDSLDMWIRMMAQVTNTPFHYFDPTGEAPSGESLRTADAPLVKKVRNRELSFTGSLIDVFTDALTLLGIDQPNVAVHWASPQSTDDLNTWQVVQAKINAGIPARQAYIEAGYTTTEIDAMGIPDNGVMSLKDRADILIDIGKAVQGLSFGVTAGIVSPEQVQQLVDALIGEEQSSASDEQAA